MYRFIFLESFGIMIMVSCKGINIWSVLFFLGDEINKIIRILNFLFCVFVVRVILVFLCWCLMLGGESF